MVAGIVIASGVAINPFRSLAVALLVGVSAAPSHAALYVCQTKQALDLEAGELQRSKSHSIELSSWETVTFDDATGLLRYGAEKREGRDAYWAEAKTTVASRGELVSAYYWHNGAIFSALQIVTYREPVGFLWVRGGNSDVLAGTCRVVGK